MFFLSPKTYHLKPTQKGFTLVETLVGIFIFSIISLGIYQGYLNILELAKAARVKGLAALVANQQLEIAHNLAYEEVGIVSGIPSGVIPREQTVTAGNVSFDITTTVRNIDQPFDGTIGGNPNDTSPADNKLVEVAVACATCKNFNPLIVTSTIAPKNLEGLSTNGALFVQVFDDSGVAIADANVHIENNQANPPIIIDETTNNDGMLQIVDVPPGNFAYEITVTKTGYSTAQTYLIDPLNNPNPLPPHSTVAAGQVTQISFAIDLVSEFEIRSITNLCAPVASVPFNLLGAKTIGTLPTVYKYDQDFTTSAGGQKNVPSLEWDTYNFTVTSATHDIAGTIPLLPIALSPGATQNVSLIMAPKNPKALLVIVKDGVTGLPLADATVQLTKSGYDETQITDRGFLRQTDWSGGVGTGANQFSASDVSGNIDHLTLPGELTLKKIIDQYQTPGWLESATFDTGSASTTYYNLSWSPINQPPDTGASSLQFQLASATSTSNPFNYLGPDGTTNSYYNLIDTNINAIHNDDRYLRYKLFMSTASSTLTPSLSDISVTYGSDCLPYGQVYFDGLATGVYSLVVSKTGYQNYSNDNVSIGLDW
ncbi:MAG: carboxypeptidase regulatory-like domain-containing protein, partial [Patescibacteria group bacterium]